MSIDSSETPRQLPDRPNLRHLACTPLGYVLRFKDVPHRPDNVATVALLQAEGAPV
jgi:hypothetical protein